MHVYRTVSHQEAKKLKFRNLPFAVEFTSKGKVKYFWIRKMLDGTLDMEKATKRLRYLQMRKGVEELERKKKRRDAMEARGIAIEEDIEMERSILEDTSMSWLSRVRTRIASVFGRGQSQSLVPSP